MFDHLEQLIPIAMNKNNDKKLDMNNLPKINRLQIYYENE